MQDEISALRKKLGVGRRELAAMLDVSPHELLAIERGHAAPPHGFEEALRALDRKTDLVNRISEESIYARRVGTTPTEGVTIAAIAFLGGIALHDSSEGPIDKVLVVALLLAGAIVLAGTRGLFPRCAECSAIAYWWRSRCPGCNRTFR